MLGWQRRPRAQTGSGAGEGDGDHAGAAGEPDRPEDSDPPGARGGPRHRAYTWKRHLAMGLLWVAMGAFLVASTLINFRR
jgi:hypothetical protein